MWCRWARASCHGLVRGRTTHSASPFAFPLPNEKKKREEPCAHSSLGFWIARATREMTTRASGTIKRELLVSCAFPAIPHPGGILGSDG